MQRTLREPTRNRKSRHSGKKFRNQEKSLQARNEIRIDLGFAEKSLIHFQRACELELNSPAPWSGAILVAQSGIALHARPCHSRSPMDARRENSIGSRVSAIIRDSPKMTFCDECLRAVVGGSNRTTIPDITGRLARGGVVVGFARSPATCGLCSQRRMVISAVNPRHPGWNALA
jgi:hypothetical protein